MCSASSSGLPENSGLKFDQFKCTNGCPLLEFVGLVELAVLMELVGLAVPLNLQGMEGQEHLALDLPYLPYIISNLCFNYDSSIIVLFDSSCVTLSPCFYFIFCPLCILVMFIYSLSLLPSFPSIYINSSLSVTN